MNPSVKKAILISLALWGIYLIFNTIASLWNEKEKEILDLYQSKVSLGYELMATKKVIFAGIGHNIEKSITHMIRNVECAGAYFDDYHVILYENDSTDKTKQFLGAWEKKSNRVTVIMEDISVTSSQDPTKRTKVLADARNRYLTVMKEDLWNQYEYVIIFDTDLPDKWDMDGIAHSFGQTTSWDVICANGITRNGKYYDAFAYRDFKGYHPELNEIQIEFPKHKSLVPVQSCFSGMAIYKKSAIEDCTYSGPECEHVRFHKCMIEKHNAKLFMNPGMIIRYPF